MMNMNRSKSGQGMTEYIIIIAIVAVAALLVTAMFGKQIKNTLGKITGHRIHRKCHHSGIRTATGYHGHFR